MENLIDQLFKSKLGEHKIAPSAEAWSKVQAGLSKKNKLVVIWRVAAALLLFGASATAWFYISDEPSIHNNQLSNKTESVQPTIESSEKVIAPVEKNEVPLIAQKETIKKKKYSKNAGEVQTQSSVKENNEVKEIIVVENEPVLTETAQVTLTTKVEKPIVIEFTLQPVTTPSSTQTALAYNDEQSGLKKLLEAALDVKNGDSDIGIRDTKNQLFALDFKKDKTKRN